MIVVASKKSEFTIRTPELAEYLGITEEKLKETINFFDSDPNDQWELKENFHFTYLNQVWHERLFSVQGAYAIAKYIDETQPQGLWERFKEFITRHKEKLRNAFINRKIQENCSSLILKRDRYFLSKKDIVSIFCTSHARINTAFREIETSRNPLVIYEDFDDIDGQKYYSFSGIDKLSRHFAKALTVEDRRAWCEAVESVSKKSFKLITDAEAAKQKRIESAMGKARSRDKNQCQITGTKRSSHVHIAAHHIYDKKNYEHLADCVDNIITLTQAVHTDFHTWLGGHRKSCTADSLIEFVQALYPDNYEVVHRLNYVKQVLSTKKPQ